MKALILFSPFISIKEVAKDKNKMFPWFMKETFNNYECIKKVQGPILFIHGQEDDIIGHHHS